MGKRWSKLQSRLYNLMDEKAEFQIHCALYEMNSNDGYHGNKLPRYFITMARMWCSIIRNSLIRR